jgi:hypothetical protein
MSTMSTSPSEELKTFTAPHAQELSPYERDRQHLRQLIVDGMNSPLVGPMDSAYIESLRQRTKARLRPPVA